VLAKNRALPQEMFFASNHSGYFIFLKNHLQKAAIDPLNKRWH
jgi:hypothetical protein